ncbi:MAG: response regulator [Alphaproteobacteria bacterium]|nr:response regulator [Alphaproteobacteria bacterium]
MDEVNDNLSGAQQAGGKAAILVVEDEALIRMVIADQLRDSGYDVVETRSADEAVALMEKGLHVDVVFSDVNLPGRLNGIGLVRWLRSQRPQIPVLLTSGAISMQDIPADLRDTELLLKPYDVDEVVRRIGPALAGAAASP